VSIHITSIVPPETGWPMAYHCRYCKQTVILHNPWALKPQDGDMFIVESCADENETHHGLREAVTRLNRRRWLVDDETA
jgi:hypothetical protein